jgi:hypothetical protein
VKRSSGLAFFAAGYLLASRRRRERRASPTATLTGVPDRRRRPQEGIVAEAAIVAHLLRLRVLTLDATVLFSPAVVTAPLAARPGRASVPRSGGALPARSGAIGRNLAEAVSNLEEGAAMLAEARGPGARGDSRRDWAPDSWRDRVSSSASASGSA